MARRGRFHHGDTCDDMLKSYCKSGLVAFLIIGQFDRIARIQNYRYMKKDHAWIYFIKFTPLLISVYVLSKVFRSMHLLFTLYAEKIKLMMQNDNDVFSCTHTADWNKWTYKCA
jgi:hypothetical protein